MFDHIAVEIYPDGLFDYRTSCEITASQFAIGREFESFARGQHLDLPPSPTGTLHSLPKFPRLPQRTRSRALSRLGQGGGPGR